MTKSNAETLLTEFFSKFGRRGGAFDRGSFVKASIGEAVLGFEFLERENVLQCAALIYQFRQPPSFEVLQAVEREEQNGADTGGGTIILNWQDNALSLVRIYDKFVDPDVFAAQMQKLAAASLAWSRTILDCAATAVVGS